MASNEEIIKQFTPCKDFYPTTVSELEDMLDAARKDEAVAFAEWVGNKFNYNQFYKTWHQRFTNNEFTTDQLYTIFKQQNS